MTASVLIVLVSFPGTQTHMAWERDYNIVFTGTSINTIDFIMSQCDGSRPNSPAEASGSSSSQAAHTTSSTSPKL